MQIFYNKIYLRKVKGGLIPMKKWVLIILTIISFCVMLFAFFYIPILTACGVKFPERNLLWGLSIIPTVVVGSLPFCFCVWKIFKNRKNKDKSID